MRGCMQVSKQEWKWRDDVKSRHGKIFQERWETEKKDKKKKTEQRKQLSVISPCRYYPQERHERFNHRLLDIFFHRCESSPEADFSSR